MERTACGASGEVTVSTASWQGGRQAGQICLHYGGEFALHVAGHDRSRFWTPGGYLLMHVPALDPIVGPRSHLGPNSAPATFNGVPLRVMQVIAGGREGPLPSQFRCGRRGQTGGPRSPGHPGRCAAAIGARPTAPDQGDRRAAPGAYSRDPALSLDGRGRTASHGASNPGAEAGRSGTRAFPRLARRPGRPVRRRRYLRAPVALRAPRRRDHGSLGPPDARWSPPHQQDRRPTCATAGMDCWCRPTTCRRWRRSWVGSSTIPIWPTAWSRAAGGATRPTTRRQPAWRVISICFERLLAERVAGERAEAK